jgi:hypothetical protein
MPAMVKTVGRKVETKRLIFLGGGRRLLRDESGVSRAHAAIEGELAGALLEFAGQLVAAETVRRSEVKEKPSEKPSA